MSLIIATGSNIGDSLHHLEEAKQVLAQKFSLIAASRVYVSKAVDYENQPDFFNQVLEFRIPALSPHQVMQELLNIEKSLGRNRNIPKGPRTIDLDIIFWGLDTINEPALTIPHPRWNERSFVVKPLQELPFFQTIEKCFTIPKSFNVDASPI
ncbi:2-amino-4-hydroxy-6-hydroxymethyldihydropteridine diphosphokinase [Peredibacter sp. HCB2-198]|uniref:2-amino-4-hydroxy-6- hydroxymethyldihydropteridine diphosphokinase n=1 Tax=Peredibacter sp. HCB2-198 TaxID=3383025 RepID=UPI0038B4C0EA